MNPIRSTWLCWCTLALLPLVWLWPCVFGGKTFVPFDPAQFPPASLTLTAEQLAETKQDSNYDVTEVWPWLLPEMELAQQEVTEGNLPQWNPHARTGAPLHEVGVLGVFYPPHWLWLFGGKPEDWLVYLTWISLALAGVFTFGLLRQVELSPLAAWFGAVTFELSGTMAANGFFWTRLPGLAWLPALLWAMMRLGEGERMRAGPLIAVAICTALPWFAGFPPYAAAGLLLAAWLAFRLVLERTGREGEREGRRLALRCAFGMFLGVLLAMPQLLPSAWFYAFEAARSADPAFHTLQGSRFEPYGLLGYLMPDALGHPLTGADLPYNRQPLCYLWGNLLGREGNPANPNYSYIEYSVFAGSLAVVLGAYGLVRGKGRLRGFAIVSLALLLGLALFVPVVRWLYYLPLVKNVPAMRWLAPGTLFVAWLAAIGFERLRLAPKRGILTLATCTFALAAAAYILTQQPAAWHAADPAWPASAIAERFGIPTPDAVAYLHIGAQPGVDRFAIAAERLAAAGSEAALWLLLCGALLAACAFVSDANRIWILRALPIVTVVQLSMHGAAILPGHALQHGTDTAVHAFLRQQAEQQKDRGGFMIARAGAGGIPTQLPPGQLMTPGIRDLSFYSHGDRRAIAPLRALLAPPIVREDQTIPNGHSYLAKVLPDEVLDRPLFDLLGVRYVLSTEKLKRAGRRVGPELHGPGGEFFVYERPNALPRAFVVPEVQVEVADDDTVPEADRRSADALVIAALIAPRAPIASKALVTADDFGSAPPTNAPLTTPPRAVRFTRDDPTVIELDVDAGTSPWLVVTDAFLPGWSATIDGDPTPILRCNHAQRLLRLPEAACHVRLEFHAPLLPYGIALFGFGLAGLAFAAAVVRRSNATYGPARPTA